MRFFHILPLLALTAIAAEMDDSDRFLRGGATLDNKKFEDADDTEEEDREIKDKENEDTEPEDPQGRDLQFGGGRFNPWNNNDRGNRGDRGDRGDRFNRPNRPNRPNQGNNRPNQGNNRPNQGNNRPNQGNNRPNQGNNRPNQGNNRPTQGNNSGVARVYQHSHSFGVYSVVKAEVSCFDVKAFCEQYLDGYVFTGAIGTLAQAAEELYIYSQCRGAARALGKSLAEIQATGEVKVGVSESDKTNIDLDVQLQSASMTYSVARTRAVAESFVQTEANGYTTVDDYCAEINAQGTPSLLCSGGNNKVESIGKAAAASFTQGFASAGAGSTTMTKAAVDVEGKNIHHVKAVLMTVAMNWAWSQSGSASQALSAAYSKVFTRQFNKLCLRSHKRMCRRKKNSDSEVCKIEPQEACDKALAVGEAKSSGFTSSFTQAFAASLASVKTSVILRAEIYQNGDSTWIEFEHDTKAGAAAAISTVCPSFSYAAEE